jgi:NADPH2:quinone reductase
VYALLPAGGGYAQHVVAPSTQLTPVPTGIRDEEALGLGIQGLTALLLLRVAARLQAGEQVFVPAAAGGVGHLAVQMAKRLGAACVIAGASTHDKRRLALELGADASVDTTRDDWPDQVRSATNQRGCDVVLAMTSGEIVEQSLRALAPLGRLVLFGADNLVNPAALDSNHMRVLLRQAQSLGGFALMQVPGHIRELALSELFEAVAAKSLRVIAHERYRLADAASAHAALESRRTIGRVFLNCD